MAMELFDSSNVEFRISIIMFKCTSIIHTPLLTCLVNALFGIPELFMSSPLCDATQTIHG